MKTKIVSVKALTKSDQARMFALMTHYYEHMIESDFQTDLSEKQKVILLLSQDQVIQGFSTILEVPMHDGSGDKGAYKFIALYSGDTVLAKDYWGNGALAMAFGRYMTQMKVRHPFTPIYWFLISKGFRTYLLMANNFPVHFPRYDRPTPDRFQSMMRLFYGKRFGDLYQTHLGVIYPPPQKRSFVRDDVSEMRATLLANPKIAFFEKSNPDWQQGVELACVAKVSLWVPIRYPLKRVLKALGRRSL